MSERKEQEAGGKWREGKRKKIDYVELYKDDVIRFCAGKGNAQGVELLFIKRDGFTQSNVSNAFQIHDYEL